jgi:hypothetical protein
MTDDESPYSDDEVSEILDARAARDARARQLYRASLARQDAELRAQKAERAARRGPFWWRPSTWVVIVGVIVVAFWLSTQA